MKTKKMPPEFKRQNRDGKYVYVKTLANGAEVHCVNGDIPYDAYDASRHFLGGSSDQLEAEYMALNGFRNWMDTISDLSLWTMWNDALDGGERPLEDEDGIQYLCLPPGRVVMSARPDKRSWDVDLMTEDDFWYRNRSEVYPDVLMLRYAEKAYRLE